MQRYRTLILGSALLVVGLATAFLAVSWIMYLTHRPAAVPTTAVQAPPPTPTPPHDQVVINRPSLRQTDESGRLAWQVRLKELHVTAGAQAVAGMREALIYDQNGAPMIRLVAQQARGNAAQRNLEVYGDVRAMSQQGALITTDTVRWLERERKLYCPGKVVLRNKSEAVTAIGLTYFVDTDTIKCPNSVRMYSGDNKLIGRDLVYNVKTQAFEMKNVQAVFNPAQARRMATQSP